MNTNGPERRDSLDRSETGWSSLEDRLTTLRVDRTEFISLARGGRFPPILGAASRLFHIPRPVLALLVGILLTSACAADQMADEPTSTAGAAAESTASSTVSPTRVDDSEMDQVTGACGPYLAYAAERLTRLSDANGALATLAVMYDDEARLALAADDRAIADLIDRVNGYSEQLGRGTPVDLDIPEEYLESEQHTVDAFEVYESMYTNIAAALRLLTNGKDAEAMALYIFAEHQQLDEANAHLALAASALPDRCTD